MDKLNRIEDWIAKELNKFAIKYLELNKKDRPPLTKSIMTIIGSYGVNEGYEVCAAGLPDLFHGEWLFDMIWYKENHEGNLKMVELVLESEMAAGIPAIKIDFEKLLLSNSNNKIMICVAGTTPINEIKDYCDNAVNTYALMPKGERVLSLIWDDYHSGEFIPHLSIKK
jgi:hypothetical protein